MPMSAHAMPQFGGAAGGERSTAPTGPSSFRLSRRRTVTFCSLTQCPDGMGAVQSSPLLGTDLEVAETMPKNRKAYIASALAITAVLVASALGTFVFARGNSAPAVT